ncbi:hypothetical protein GCM10009696_27820 [Kocuria himachalensis]
MAWDGTRKHRAHRRPGHAGTDRPGTDPADLAAPENDGASPFLCDFTLLDRAFERNT